MYRAVTWHVLQHAVEASDERAVVQLLEASRVDCRPSKDGAQILIDQADLSTHFRDGRVNENVSIVSRFPRVREILVAVMRAYADERDVVMEGRDIGSV